MPTVHKTYKCKEGTIKYVFDPKVAASYHYRDGRLGWEYNKNKSYVDDLTMYRWKERILGRINKVMHEVMKLGNDTDV